MNPGDFAKYASRSGLSKQALDIKQLAKRTIVPALGTGIGLTAGYTGGSLAGGTVGFLEGLGNLPKSPVGWELPATVGAIGGGVPALAGGAARAAELAHPIAGVDSLVANYYPDIAATSIGTGAGSAVGSKFGLEHGSELGHSAGRQLREWFGGDVAKKVPKAVDIPVPPGFMDEAMSLVKKHPLASAAGLGLTGLLAGKAMSDR
jgi:hypothetical protein